MKTVAGTIIALAVLASCRPAAADKVAVLPVLYRLVWEGAESAEKASAIGQEVAAALAENGFEAVTATDDCRNRECLAEVAARLGVENAIFVSVAEEGLMASVEIALARGEPQRGPIGGNFKTLRAGVREMVRQAVGRPAEKPPAASPGGEGGRSDALRIVELPAADRLARLDPLPFAVTAGVTGGLAIAWVAVEAVGYAKLRKLESDSGYDWSKKDAENLQIADRVLLATAAAGAAAAIVLGVFTDFRNRRKAGSLKAVLPAALARGGMLAIEGSF